MKESMVIVEPDLHIPLNAATLADLVETSYCVGKVCRVTEVLSSPASFVWQVKTCDNQGDHDFCLKSHKDKPAERIRLEHDLIKALKAERFELVPAVIPRVDGDTVTGFAGSNLALYDFIPSEPAFDWTAFSWDDSHAALAGAALAELHDAAGSVVEKITQAQRSMLSSDGDVRAALVATSGCDQFSFLPIESRGTLAAVARQALSYLDAAVAPSDTAIHGDFHPGNLLFSGQQVVGLLDFDYFRLGRRYFDVAYAMIAFGLDRHGSFNESRADKFLTGYHERAFKLASLCNLPFVTPVALKQEMALAGFLIACWLVGQSEADTSMRLKLAPALESALSAIRLCLD